jgi:hypothetical protein
MRKKHKRKHHFNIRPELAGAMYLIGLAGLILQSHANLSVHVKKYEPIAAVTLFGPVPKSTPSPSPTPPPPAPTPSPAPVNPRIAYYPAPKKYVPPVAPAPDSNVQHLVTVTQPPAGNTGSTGLGSGTGGGSPSPSPSGTPQPASYSYESYNWSGYISAGGKFTGVRGSWVVPSVSGSAGSTDAAWIGIGGVTAGDLIQVGTTETVLRGGRIAYEAFYELLPAAETGISMTVSAGDVMSADIAQQGSGDWLVTLNDTTCNETFTITVPYSSSYSTAEWIEEDPSYSNGSLVPFDNFGSIDFSGGTTTENGASQTISSSGGAAVIMVNTTGKPVAIPSVLTSDGAGFRVTGG